MYAQPMSLLKRLFGSQEPDPKLQLVPLYNRVVAHARDPHWYIDGGVPDTMDGRFDMVAAMMTLTILRLEKEPDHAADMALLTELFVDDMDGQLRQVGIGEMVVGKHVGKMMSALGGRLAAFRPAFAGEADLDAAILRNIYRSTEAPSAAALAHVRSAFVGVKTALDADSAADIAAGQGKW